MVAMHREVGGVGRIGVQFLGLVFFLMKVNMWEQELCFYFFTLNMGRQFCLSYI